MPMAEAPESAPLARYNLRYVWTISLVAAMGGLLFGYDWVVIGGARPFLEKFYRLTSQAEIGWANSCALVGCLLGSLVSGALSDGFGRKKLLVASALLFAASSVLTGWAPSFGWFVTWRISGGIAIGMASNLSPMYIAEVSPAHLRGRLVAANQLTIVIGILAAQIVNWVIAVKLPHHSVTAVTVPQLPALVTVSTDAARQAWNQAYGWRWMFTAVTVPSLLFLAGALFVPESPRWLMTRGERERARAVLARIGGQEYADFEVQDVDRTLATGQAEGTRLATLAEAGVMRVLAVGVALAVLQQWSGINSIFNYAEEIYRSAGYGISDIMFNIVMTGSINLAFTLVAMGTVDRVGRRTLMLVGCAGIGLSHVLLGSAYAMHWTGTAVLVFTLCSLGCYAMSLAPITWVLIAEIFPNRIRGAAVSVAVSALWVACFILTFAFPLLQGTIGIAGTFYLYAGICFAGFAFVWLNVPETKGRSLEDIEREMGQTPVNAGTSRSDRRK